MTEQPRLNQPVRAVVALAEVLLAAVAVWGAFQLWPHGVHTVAVTLTDGTVLTSTRWIGSWMAGAIGLGVVAGILLADAVREILLATRVKRRRKSREGGGDGDDFGYFAGHLNQA
ncbi:MULTISPECIES: hypothetical protein [Amycolatopsis]|uniref:Uncharacterized protein n=1 Tax=Amycolatopsis thermalba TaxID=944492 RepID=A0ABY4NQU1_9PSEU|nr:MULTISPECIES: hypothetical protein [Amycolatopsis]OXM74067.1 hypothetical protein CF166_06345 [Amycolatopsis sp. KNN50.9b]UQS22204.1 hypothetical protein L1857_04890 [Amycolatopsis thermalba]